MTCDDYAFVADWKLYIGRDNAITVIPYCDFANLVNYDMTAVTRVVANADLINTSVVGDSVVGDSAIDPSLVWWDEVTNDDGEQEWRIYCKVGLFTGIAAATYLVRITIFDPAHPNGLVLPETDSTLQVTVVGLP